MLIAQLLTNSPKTHSPAHPQASSNGSLPKLDTMPSAAALTTTMPDRAMLRGGELWRPRRKNMSGYGRVICLA